MYWTLTLDGNYLSQDQVVNFFLGSQEYATSGTGCPPAVPVSQSTNSPFLTCLYNDAFHRAPDPGGFNFYLNGLNGNATSRSGVVQNFISSEFSSVNGPYLTSYVQMNGVTSSPAPGL